MYQKRCTDPTEIEWLYFVWVADFHGHHGPFGRDDVGLLLSAKLAESGLPA
jgi:hypothetical protein